MVVFLGVDTGGTYTDAVLIRDEAEVIASAKSLTTRHDLAVGIGAAVRAVLSDSGIAASDISLVSMSTTLATNALVEGQGGRVGLVFIGFDPADVDRQGLTEALRGDPVIVIAGGHTHSGQEAAPLDIKTLRTELATLGDGLSGFAVAAQFATRNPAHEIEVRDLIREVTGAPVSCSHELSAKLGGPKRAMTAVLNARLIGMIDHLIAATQGLMLDLGITAPLMVVRGDGALINAHQARQKPIETILSGPAASIVGARWLTDETDAMVSDIGGTTTDIALLRAGRPQIDPQGAMVGGLRTMVEAVAMRTTGLGGDSEVHMAKEGLAAGLQLGPRRLIPISLMAMDWPDVVHATLEKQMQDERSGEMAARFVLRIDRSDRVVHGLLDRDAAVLARIGTDVRPLAEVITSQLDVAALNRLVARGLVMIAGVTPSDAAHVLGQTTVWDRQAAEMALDVFARQRTGAGVRLAANAAGLAAMIVDQLTEQTAEALMEAGFAEEAGAINGRPSELARHPLVKAGHDGHHGIVAVQVGLNLPVIGLGASARAYYGSVGARLRTPVILPEHGGVANAIGAVVGQITMRKAAEIAGVGDGQYRVHFENGPEIFTDEDAAITALVHNLSDRATQAALAAGAADVHVSVDKDVQHAEIEGQRVFVSALITVTATGRPRIAVE